MLKKMSYIFNMSSGKTKYGEIHSKVLRRIRAKGSRWAFTPGDFSDIGEPRAVGMVLTRLNKKGLINRVRRGVYEIPHSHPILGKTGASEEALAQALARRDGLKVIPSAATAANELGLSTQVGAHKTYNVVGSRARTVKIAGGSELQIKKRSDKMMAISGKVSGHLAQALQNIGKGNVSQTDLKRLGTRLTTKDRKQLIADMRFVPAWMRPYFKKVAQND
jgi:hypothetical protein